MLRSAGAEVSALTLDATRPYRRKSEVVRATLQMSRTGKHSDMIEAIRVNDKLSDLQISALTVTSGKHE